jgi:hypothetical protein
MQNRHSPSRRVTGHNETLSLELSGAGEPPCSSCASGGPEAGKTECAFSVRDTSGEERAKNLKRRLGCDKFVIHESDGRNRAC